MFGGTSTTGEIYLLCIILKYFGKIKTRKSLQNWQINLELKSSFYNKAIETDNDQVGDTSRSDIGL